MANNHDALKGMPDEFVICRMLRHNWSFLGFYNAVDSDGRAWVALALECQLCGMTRDDYMDHRGQLLARYYSPPSGFYVTRKKNEKREGRILVAETRAEMLGRSNIYKDSSALTKPRKQHAKRGTAARSNGRT